MPDLICHVNNHNYEDGDVVYVSWLGGVYYVYDSDYDSVTGGVNKSFKLSTTAADDGSYVQFTTSITDGFVREDDQTGVTTISGLDHLEGEQVYVTSGGRLRGIYTVSSGSITLNQNLTTYQAGKFEEAVLEPMDIDYQGSGHTTVKRPVRIYANVYETKGGKIGQESGHLEPLASLTDLYTGIKEISVPGGYARDPKAYIKQDVPLPMTVLSISYDLGVARD